MINLIARNRSDLSRGSIELYFNIDGAFFPDARWTDIKSAPRSWLAELDDLGSGGPLYFLDGPFGFEVTEHDGNYHFDFFEREAGAHHNSILTYTSTASEYRAFLNALREFVLGTSM